MNVSFSIYNINYSINSLCVLVSRGQNRRDNLTFSMLGNKIKGVFKAQTGKLKVLIKCIVIHRLAVCMNLK